MVKKRAARDSLAEMQAQYMVCSHLTRACRQAISEIALDEADDLIVRRRAVALLKEILGDWADAQRWLRSNIARRQRPSSLTPR